MTSYNAIRDAIIAKIKTAFPAAGIYGEEIQQGYKRPAFYVQLIPEATQALNKSHRQKQLLVVVHYFSLAAANTRSRDMWRVADELDYSFGTHLVVGNRSLYIEETNPEIIDEVLQYHLKLSYTDSRDDAIEVLLDGGTKDIIMPEPELGYVAGDVVPMRTLTIKEE